MTIETGKVEAVPYLRRDQDPKHARLCLHQGGALEIGRWDKCLPCGGVLYREDPQWRCCNQQFVAPINADCDLCGSIPYNATSHYCLNPRRSAIIPSEEVNDIQFCGQVDPTVPSIPYLPRREKCCYPECHRPWDTPCRAPFLIPASESCSRCGVHAFNPAESVCCLSDSSTTIGMAATSKCCTHDIHGPIHPTLSAVSNTTCFTDSEYEQHACVESINLRGRNLLKCCHGLIYPKHQTVLNCSDPTILYPY